MGAEAALGLAAALFFANGAAEGGPRERRAAPREPERAFAVSPGAPGTPLPSGSWPRGGAPRLIWTGFQLTEAGSRVFVQVTRDVDLEVQTVKGGLAVTLRNCRIHMRNNSRTLDTRFFDSPVKEIAVRQRGRAVVLAIALKEPAAATPRKQAGPGGSQFWVLDFAPPAASRPAPPAPKDAQIIDAPRPRTKARETASVAQTPGSGDSLK